MNNILKPSVHNTNEILIKKLKGCTRPTCMTTIFEKGRVIWLRRWSIREGRECRVVEEAFKVDNYFWTTLDALVKKGSMYWAFGWRMYALLCKAGVYEIVESGGWNLLGGNNVERKSGQDGSKRGTWGALVCEDVPTILDLRTPSGGKIRFVDLANYGLRPSMFLEDGETETLDTATQAIQDYLKLLDTYGMGSLKTTAASQAYACYRRSHMNHWIFSHGNSDARKLERSACFTGRAEAFRLGPITDHVYHVDVKGMYNSLAQVFPFPRRMAYYTQRRDEAASILRESADKSIARVTIATSENDFPVRYDGRVIYPVGEFETCLAGPELVTAVATGRVIEVHELAVYDMGMLFKGFADWYFATAADLENQGLGHIKAAFKLSGNTLYGKFGTRGKNWTDCENIHKPTKWGQWFGTHKQYGFLTQYRAINGRTQYLDGSFEPATSCPAISAFMSSYGRVKLGLLIATAGKENVHYIDTDGLMVNAEGFERLVRSGQFAGAIPGKLVIKEESDDVDIFGIKHYRFGSRVCCAGAIVSEQEARAYMTQFVNHTPFEHSLQHKTPFDHSYTNVKKSRTGKYQHGKLNADGSVSPHFMQPTVLEYFDEQGKPRYSKIYQVLGSAVGVASKSAAASDMSASNQGGTVGGRLSAL